eukprot:COSAG03_NODE_5896_length_1154_cov_1.911848_2_plen_91_part_00
MSATGDPSSMRGNRPLIDVDSLLPPSPAGAGGARRSPRVGHRPAVDPESIPAGTMPTAAIPSPKSTRSSPRVQSAKQADKQFELLQKMLG